MVEEQKIYNITRMEFLKRGRVEFMELENKRLCIKEEKIRLAKMKVEMERMKEERERMKEERKKMKKERETLEEEKEIMTIDIDALPLVQQEYFRLRQLEIFAKRIIDN